MNNHLMLDIETAGTGPSAYVLTMGWVLFDPYGDGSADEKHYVVLDDCANKGRKLTRSTINWWLTQGELARSNAWLAAPSGSPAELLDGLSSVDNIWANDPDFDCVIVQDLMESSGLKFKWPFHKHRSMRTIKELFDIQIPFVGGVAHNALDDCLHQIKFVRAVYQGKANPKFYKQEPGDKIEIGSRTYDLSGLGDSTIQDVKGEG